LVADAKPRAERAKVRAAKSFIVVYDVVTGRKNDKDALNNRILEFQRPMTVHFLYLFPRGVEILHRGSLTPRPYDIMKDEGTILL
jgi:hypothetical protein